MSRKKTPNKGVNPPLKTPRFVFGYIGALGRGKSATGTFFLLKVNLHHG